MNQLPKRIFIVGSAGAGKTTFAQLICQKLNLFHTDLDHIAYPLQKVRPIKDRSPYVKRLADKPRWVAEGAYVSWVKDLLEKSDQILWLDLPLYITLTRITKRFLINILTGKDPHGFKAFIRLIRSLLHYHFPLESYEIDEEGEYITREKIKKALEPYHEKVIRVTNPNKLKRYLNTF